MRRLTPATILVALLFTAPGCSDFLMRDCERGNFVGLIVPQTLPYPITLKVGASITVSANYGTGKGNQGENCDQVLFTSLERPDEFSFVSTNPTVATISDAGRVVAMAPGQTVIYPIAKGLHGRDEQITVVP